MHASLNYHLNQTTFTGGEGAAMGLSWLPRCHFLIIMSITPLNWELKHITTGSEGKCVSYWANVTHKDTWRWRIDTHVSCLTAAMENIPWSHNLIHSVALEKRSQWSPLLLYDCQKPEEWLKKEMSKQQL